MVPSRKRPKGVRCHAPFGLCVLAMSLMPTLDRLSGSGRADGAAVRSAAARARAHAGVAVRHHPCRDLQLSAAGRHADPRARRRISSPASAPTIPRSTGALGSDPSGARAVARPRADFPAVNRRLKGDLLVTRPREDEPPPRHPRSDAGPGEDRFVPATRRRADADAIGRRATERGLDPSRPNRRRPRSPLADTEDESNAAVRLGRLYFGNTIGDGVGTIQPWPADEEVRDRGAARPRSGHQAVRVGVAAADDFNFETASARRCRRAGCRRTHAGAARRSPPRAR